MAIDLPRPQLQIDFALALEQIRSLYLQDALAGAVANLDVAAIDKELAAFAPASALKTLATHGLRGELVFAVPVLLEESPFLLGYYRLLLGYSQKAFYGVPGVGGFKSMEEKGTVNAQQKTTLGLVCKALTDAASMLLEGLGSKRITREFLDDLTLLTVGPQLRGGSNVRVGTTGIGRVFDAISAIVTHAATESTSRFIRITNAAGRRVLIQFASDPDIRVQEQMTGGIFRNILAIEVKAGLDFSNVHNRLGEAEKSHQKAKAEGYNERWTIINIDRVDMVMARQESPSTDRFYRMSQVESGMGPEYVDFRDRVVSLTNIAGAPAAVPPPSRKVARKRRTKISP